MARSKPAALPLGDTPTVMPDKDYQTPLKMAGVLGFEPRNGEIKTRCLTAWRYPNFRNSGGYDGIRTCDPRIMSAML